jgi:hypothetical protein
MRHVLRLILVLAAMVMVLPGQALAVCNQSNVSLADSALWAAHGCSPPFFLWQSKFFNMSKDDWGNRGWNQACTNTFEYPKTWNAAFLVVHGLADNNAQSFHGTVDYLLLAGAQDSAFHDALYYDASDNTSFSGFFQYHWPGDDEITLTCALFNPGFLTDNPASRAGDFMHEGWHGWLVEGGWNPPGHLPGPQGDCTLKGNACDYFYFHGIGAFAFGALWETDGTNKRFHSPNQVQVEFLCDVSDQPKPWVPAGVRVEAKADADVRSIERFINGPGYTCGSPRPW